MQKNKYTLKDFVVFFLILGAAAFFVFVILPHVFVSFNSENLHRFLENYSLFDVKEYLQEEYGSVGKIYDAEQVVSSYAEDDQLRELYDAVMERAAEDSLLYEDYVFLSHEDEIRSFVLESGLIDDWYAEAHKDDFEFDDTEEDLYLAYEEGYADAKRDFDEWLHSNEGFYEVLSAALYDFWDNTPPTEGSSEYELWSVIRDIYNDYR